MDHFLNTLLYYSPLVSALATIVISFATVLNYKMYKVLQEKDEKYKKNTEELYKKIVAATLASTYPYAIAEQNYTDILKRISAGVL